MSLPKCFQLLNGQYFSNQIAQINASATQQELQQFVNQIFGDLSTLESTITSQIQFMNLLTPLLIAPGDLPGLITWAGNFVTFLQQQYLPYINLAAQLVQLATQISSLTAAINAIALEKGFTITIPPVSITCTL